MRIFSYLAGRGGGARGNRIVMNFCKVVGVHDVITHANLGDDRLGDFWGSGGRISHFFIDLIYRLCVYVTTEGVREMFEIAARLTLTKSKNKFGKGRCILQ